VVGALLPLAQNLEQMALDVGSLPPSQLLAVNVSVCYISLSPATAHLCICVIDYLHGYQRDIKSNGKLVKYTCMRVTRNAYPSSTHCDSPHTFTHTPTHTPSTH
jgi:hypothetical protein